jgi:hypothetical protein
MESEGIILQLEVNKMVLKAIFDNKKNFLKKYFSEIFLGKQTFLTTFYSSSAHMANK